MLGRLNLEENMRNTRKKVKQVYIVMTFILVAISLNPLKIIAASEPEYKSKYIGQEKRDIKSLSNEDIKELRAGAGWGLAKAAELNGLPGPKHILEMKKEIELTAEQEKMVIALYKDMNKEAIVLGNKLIEYEEELNNRFAERNIDEKMLDQLLEKISETYKSLRYTHLSAHLKTPSLLTENQIKKYNKLRGYSSDDPCVNIPKGHDSVMWRKHNNCD
jgi:Spy/CpxP family protein refolding chaperone